MKAVGDDVGIERLFKDGYSACCLSAFTNMPLWKRRYENHGHRNTFPPHRFLQLKSTHPGRMDVGDDTIAVVEAW
jgi:hypothetical protein